jgi:ABC-type branched-subunit amino acid transport system substrate-binding protein
LAGRARRFALPVLLAAAVSLPAIFAQEVAEPAPDVAAGKQIYQTGTSPSGDEIVAVLAGDTELPASALPCSSCHAEDGRGNPEGGVAPSDLTWSSLTRPYGVSHPGGREHPPYDERLLKRAIALGVDPAGNELHVGMPRYRMSLEDMNELVAYIRQLGIDRDPGVDEESLTVGTLLPPTGAMSGVGEAIGSTLESWASNLNEAGGLYGRKVKIVTLELPVNPEEQTAAVSDFVEKEDVFALVGAFLAGTEDRLPDLLEELKVPLVGPFTLRPKLDEPVNPWVFYLLPGLSVQGRALVSFAADRVREREDELPVATVLHPEGDPTLADVAQAMLAEGKREGWARMEERTYRSESPDPLGMAAALGTIDSQVLFFLGPSADRQLLLQAGEHFTWYPEVYTPGSMAGPEALETPPPYDGRFFLSFPTLPDDRTDEAANAYHHLAETYHLSPAHLTTQLSTLAAARLFEEGAKRAGHALTRALLIGQLEQLYKWDCGLTPPLTFTPNRRVGAQGAYVVAVDRKERTFHREGGWVEVD